MCLPMGIRQPARGVSALRGRALKVRGRPDLIKPDGVSRDVLERGYNLAPDIGTRRSESSC